MLKSTDYNKLNIIQEAKALMDIAAQEEQDISFSEALEVVKISKLKAISEALSALKQKP